MKILVLEPVGLHLGYVGAYGNDWIATPCLDELASRGVVFDQHFLDRPHIRLPLPENRTAGLADPLQQAGKSWHVAHANNLTDYVRTVRRAWKHLPDSGICWVEGPSLAPPWDIPADVLGAYLDDENNAWSDAPSGPMGAEFDLARWQESYAGAVTYFDAQLGRALEAVNAETLVIVHAAAGLELGEHGHVGWEGARQREAMIHVPMIWRVPGLAEGVRIASLTQPIDLFASLLTALEVSAPSAGFNLWPLVRGEKGVVREIAMGSWQGRHYWRDASAALYLEQKPELYVKPDDRWEVNDVVQHAPEKAERMEASLRAWLAENVTS